MSLAEQGLADEVRNHAAVERVHPRAVGVEDSHQANVHLVRAAIVHEQRFGHPLAFVVTGPRADRIDRAAIAFRLRMDLRIAIDFAGRGLQDFGPAAFGHAQHVDRAHHRRFDGFDRIELIVAGSGGASQVVDFVDFQPDRMDHVVREQFEIRPVEQMRDVRLLAGEEVVEADHVVSLLDQPLAQVRAQEAGPAGHQDPLVERH